MYKAWRDSNVSYLALYRIEVSILQQLIAEFVERVQVEEVVALDDFDLWSRGLGPQSVIVNDDDRDPLLDRLFPAVFPDDEVASAEHRRFSENDLRRQKAAEADILLEELERAQLAESLSDLDSEEPVYVVKVADVALQVWLRTLNSLRIALSMQLDINSAEDMAELEAISEKDDRSYLFLIYELLGEMQGVLLALQGFE
ncbi:MAG: DUF2017 family protein [Propionibacteriaceae bacterium]